MELVAKKIPGDVQKLLERQGVTIEELFVMDDIEIRAMKGVGLNLLLKIRQLQHSMGFQIPVVVTNNPVVAELLKEKGLVPGNSKTMTEEEVTREALENRHVFYDGNLPIHLAGVATSVTFVQFNIPEDLRGLSMSLDMARSTFLGIHSYVIHSMGGLQLRSGVVRSNRVKNPYGKRAAV